MTRRERMLTASLRSVWDTAAEALEGEEQGHMSFRDLSAALRTVAEEAAEALADLPVTFALTDGPDEAA
jgi:predicted heme/steroid binding protein